jgi:hypothetical protein
MILEFQCLFFYVLLPTNEGHKGEGTMEVVTIVHCFETLPFTNKSAMPMAPHKRGVIEHFGKIVA